MKVKKWLLYVNLLLAMILLGLAVVIYFKVHICIVCVIRKIWGDASLEFFYDVAMAVFGGAFLGFIIVIFEYNDERRKAMEQFYQEADKALTELRKIKYCHFDAPEELVISCFVEESHNKKVDENGELAPKMGLFHEHTARDSLVDWYKRENLFSGDAPDELIQKYRRGIFECMESCLEIAKLDLNLLGNAYANLDFVVGNRCLRSRIAYDRIYKPIKDCRDMIFEESSHFKSFKEGEGKLSDCARRVIEIRNQLFESKEIDIGGSVYAGIYMTKFHNVDVALELFRCKIYYRSKPEDIKNAPVYGYSIHRSD